MSWMEIIEVLTDRIVSALIYGDFFILFVNEPRRNTCLICNPREVKSRHYSCDAIKGKSPIQINKHSSQMHAQSKLDILYHSLVFILNQPDDWKIAMIYLPQLLKISCISIKKCVPLQFESLADSISQTHVQKVLKTMLKIRKFKTVWK